MTLTQKLYIFVIGALLLFGQANAQLLVPIAEEDLTPKVESKRNVKKVLAVLKDLKKPIKSAAKAFGIDPIHVAGAIAGEHAFNVSIVDSVQNLVADSWTNAQVWEETTQQYPEKDLSVLIRSEKYQKCRDKRSDYELWICVVETWNKSNLINILSGQQKFFVQFTSHFFNPNTHVDLGMTFGVGQMSPVRALMVDDLVARAGQSSVRFWETGDVGALYEKILNPKKVVYYIAATVKYSMAVYENQGNGFDISANPGLTATLYNLGNEKILLKKTLREKRLPETNTLGKWVNQNQALIRDAIK
ncbi:MAG: DUF1402 family protein [Bdellovibrionaceae bacterium]|nr:DUF1402 family protein [Pseudobdellovibrionaceae bacterium]